MLGHYFYDCSKEKHGRHWKSLGAARGLHVAEASRPVQLSWTIEASLCSCVVDSKNSTRQWTTRHQSARDIPLIQDGTEEDRSELIVCKHHDRPGQDSEIIFS